MKKYKSIIITVALGVLSSALWEQFIKPCVFFIYDRIVISIVHFCSDSFYVKVAKSLDSPQALTYYYFLMFCAFFFLVNPKLIYNFYHGNSEPHKMYFKTIAFAILAFNAFTLTIENEIARSTMRNIEIVAPYISDVEYKTLKSDFYRMSSKEDYQNLITQIDALMDENGLSE